MKITLVIPAYNEEKYIGACLESVQKYGTGIFEVIVVNNASTDKTEQIALSFSGKIIGLRVVNESKKGLPVARQRGLDEAVGEIVAFIDADAKIPKGWLEKIEKEFKKDVQLVCLSGPYIYYDLSFFSKALVWLYFILAWPVYIFVGYMAIAGNLVVKADVFRNIGGFDQSIDFYGDDTDIARRLHEVGHTTFSYTFYMYTSARRLKGEGIIGTAFHYVINFFSVVLRGKPYTHEHSDIR